MKELGKDLKRILLLVGGLLVLYLIIHYWTTLEAFVALGVDAAQPLILGCIMAYVINILMNFYERWYDRLFKVAVARKIKRIVCMIFAFLSLGCIVALIINLVLPELINCIASFIGMIPAAVDWLVGFIGEEQLMSYFPMLQGGLDFSSLSTQIEEMIKTLMNNFGGAVGSIVTAVTSVFSLVLTTVIGLIFSLYLLLDKERLSEQGKRVIRVYLPQKAEKIFYVLHVLNDSFHRFIVGQCTEAVVLGVLCIIGMWIFRFPYAVMIGAFIGFTALIPIAGAYIGAAVGAVMMLTTSPILAVEFLIFIIVLQQLEGNLIYPRVVGSSIGLPGIWVLIAITVGGGVLGIGGMLLAVPLAAALYRLLREDLSRRDGGNAEVSEVQETEASGLVEEVNMPEEIVPEKVEEPVSVEKKATKPRKPRTKKTSTKTEK